MGTRPPEGPPPAATEGVGNRSPDTPTELLLRFARAGHDAGYPTADLEERLQALATSFGLADAEVSVTPTLVEISLGSLPRQRSYSLRVRPAAVDLDAIARLDDLVQDALDARLDANGALAALGDIEREPLH
ncbi:MAG: threonine/serine exporter family protein, partial [Actinomycetota bacterium]